MKLPGLGYSLADYIVSIGLQLKFIKKKAIKNSLDGFNLILFFYVKFL